MESFDISKKTVLPSKKNINPKPHNQDEQTGKRPLPNNHSRQQHTQLTENHHQRQNSHRGETQRSKRSEDTAIALDTLLDDIYLKDATAAKVFKFKDLFFFSYFCVLHCST